MTQTAYIKIDAAYSETHTVTHIQARLERNKRWGGFFFANNHPPTLYDSDSESQMMKKLRRNLPSLPSLAESFFALSVIT